MKAVIGFSLIGALTVAVLWLTVRHMQNTRRIRELERRLHDLTVVEQMVQRAQGGRPRSLRIVPLPRPLTARRPRDRPVLAMAAAAGVVMAGIALGAVDDDPRSPMPAAGATLYPPRERPPRLPDPTMPPEPASATGSEQAAVPASTAQAAGAAAPPLPVRGGGLPTTGQPRPDDGPPPSPTTTTSEDPAVEALGAECAVGLEVTLPGVVAEVCLARSGPRTTAPGAVVVLAG